jgi:hypothetical protein
MFERGEQVVRITGGLPMIIISITVDHRGQRRALCEGQDEYGRLRTWQIAEEELALYFPPRPPRLKSDSAV